MSSQDPTTKPPGMLQDGTGATSSMRFIMVLWMTMLITGIITLVFVNHSFPHLDPVYAEITFVVLLGKTGQSFAENWQNKP